MPSTYSFTYLFLNLSLGTCVKYCQAKMPHCLYQCESYTTLWSWCQYLCHEQLVQSNTTSSYQRPAIFLEGDYWLESLWSCLKWSTEGARGKHRENNPFISCLSIKTPVQNILYVPGVVGVGSVCDIQPREELLSNCALPSGCLQLPVMFCFDDGNSSILCSGGSVCIPLGICCVHRFSVELVWFYQLRCQTHLLL